MKTIVHIELSDEERSDLAKELGHKGMVTRQQVKDFVQVQVQLAILRGGKDDQGSEVERDSPPADQGDSGQRGQGGRDSGIPRHDPAPGFVPSRGDEPYLSQPKDPGIAAACSRILDDAALIEKFAWDTIERNRK